MFGNRIEVFPLFSRAIMIVNYFEMPIQYYHFKTISLQLEEFIHLDS